MPPAIEIAGTEIRQDFDRDVTIELGVPSAIDVALPPAPSRATISYGPRRMPADRGMVTLIPATEPLTTKEN
jgi:hypothetical protein